MIQQFEQLEKSVDRLADRLAAVLRERDAARAEVAALKAQVQEKDLEVIRTRKEMQRAVETLEREKMGCRRTDGDGAVLGDP
jgi:chromosome segregation ATPase